MQSGLIERLLHRHADKPVVGFSVVFVCEMNVISGYQLYIMLLSQLNKMFVNLGLLHKYIPIGIFFKRLVTLKFYVIIITERLLVP